MYYIWLDGVLLFMTADKNEVDILVKGLITGGIKEERIKTEKKWLFSMYYFRVFIIRDWTFWVEFF